MKTILLISPYWKENHRWMVSSVKLAELWQRLGYKVVVLCMGSPGQGQEGKKAKGQNTFERVSDSLEIHRVPDIFLKDPWNYGIAWGFSGKALKLAKELKPEIIIVNKILFWSSIALIRLRMKGYKVLLTSDALVGITWWPRGRLAKICAAIYAWTLGWLILKAATKIILFHPQPSDVLRKLGIEKKSMVIPTGIDHKAMSYELRAESEIARSSITVTYIGRLESVKGVDDFVAAALKVKKDHPELEAKVVGWFPSTSSGQVDHPLVQKYSGEINFTGLRDDTEKILMETDIFVLPSYSEGLSNALMEAMASGCACIASEVGGNTFLIENGKSGFLFPAGDREALASHIRRLVEDPAKRTALGAAARKRIEEKFSWDKVGEQYRDVFKVWMSDSSLPDC